MTEDSERIDPVREAALRSVNQVNRVISAMLVEAVDQIRKSPNTWQHEEVTVTMNDLADKALAVPHLAPRDVVFATARASAAVVVALSDKLGVDPAGLLRSFEENLFRETL